MLVANSRTRQETSTVGSRCYAAVTEKRSRNRWQCHVRFDNTLTHYSASGADCSALVRGAHSVILDAKVGGVVDMLGSRPVE
jgi:hypothetical protein